MKIVNTKFKDLKLIKTPIYKDNRGYFRELLLEKRLTKISI